jgi:hypothetical protein
MWPKPPPNRLDLRITEPYRVYESADVEGHLLGGESANSFYCDGRILESKKKTYDPAVRSGTAFRARVHSKNP